MSDVKNKPRRWTRRRIVRWVIRLTFLTASVVTCVGAIPIEGAERWVPAASPLTSIGSAIAVRAISWGSAVAIGIFVLSMFIPRVFCLYACPMGTTLDCVGCTGHGKTIVRRLPRMGIVLAAFSWGLALAGLPLLLWLDPLAIFSAFLGHGEQRVLIYSGATLILLTLWLPRIWCMKICPLGGVQDLARIPARILRSLRRRRIVNASKLSEESEIEDVFPHRSSRREFLRYVAVGAGLLSGVALGVFLPQNVLKKRRRKFRPPGMPDSDLAAALCVRCGNCMDVCPTKILAIQSEPVGGLEVGLPQLTIGGPGVYCLDDCNTCGVACPSGAIAGLPLDEKRDWKIGLARLELDLCLHTWDRECGICRRECPRGAVSMEWSQEWYTQIPVIDKKLCNGCGACIGMCPGTNTWEVEGDPATPVRRALEVKPVKESS
jgi:ferredoxin-type protein NapG